MAKTLAIELGRYGITANAVAPGFIDTEMTQALPPAVREAILARIPLGRMGAAEEVAEVVAWLATRASYVHGTVIHVNGGMYGG
jgi:3-oxoacyl-[acyl-carrier protein] reductase